MDREELFPRQPARIAPGAVHLPEWLSPQAQQELLAACRRWAQPPAGLRTVRMPRGGQMSVRQVCLGWHWYAYGYARTVTDGPGAGAGEDEGTPVKPFPAWLGRWARRAVTDAGGAEGLGAGNAGDAGDAGDVGDGEDYDVALVNFYGAGARMGMHRDSDERSDAPVVSFSLGDSCVFRFGNTRGRGRPWTDVDLRSGDAFVFGGPSRSAYHGVPRIRPGSGPAFLGLQGRLNVTVRVAGLG